MFIAAELEAAEYHDVDLAELSLEFDQTMRAIGQAEDIVAAKLGIDADEACSRLYALAKIRNQDPKEIASAVIGGTLPTRLFAHPSLSNKALERRGVSVRLV